MGIDEFIEKYTESEVDKIQRRDVIDRFSKKKAIQNIATSQSDAARESSPIRKS